MERQMTTSILIVDDEQAFLESVTRMLRLEGYEDLTPLTDPRQALPLLEERNFDVAFLDITMPGMDGLELLQIIKERSPQTECVMITANESIPLVIKAVRRGAYDYLLKPLLPEQLIQSLERALERRRLLEAARLRAQGARRRALRQPEAFAEIVTGDREMLRLLHEAELHAASEIPVLITGETGVGKELLARAVHHASRRASGPFVAVNMLSLSPTLFESEFFGHVKGAFTGADRDKAGYMAQANGGALFLDEIGDLSLEIQGKLLRILQEGEFTPVGRTRPEPANVRFIAATNQDLEKLVQQKRFRKDLYYRLQFAVLPIPPLRDRPDDVLLLAAHFLGAAGKRLKIEDEAHEALLEHVWPGNVRELKGVIEAAANLAERGVIEAGMLRLPVRSSRETATAPATKTGALEPLADVERRHILAVYDALGGNKSQTARVLDIGLQTLHRKLKEYGVR
jgi:two-component system response regulator AtoC